MPERDLPELARSLRSLGAQPDAASEAAHHAVFVPLLEARARANGRSAEAALAALRGASLMLQVEKGTLDAVVQGVPDAARARALRAEAMEILEPLRAAFGAADDAASAARADAQGWEAWIGRLQAAFEAADLACRRLARLIGARIERRQSLSWFDRDAR